MFESISITPLQATLLFIVAVIAGHLYRKTWKDEGQRWKLWVYGSIAGGFLMIVAFVPLSI